MKRKMKISYELIMFLILAALVVMFGVLTGGIFSHPGNDIGYCLSGDYGYAYDLCDSYQRH